MVDIERKGLTLDDWTKGISSDEYAGGSYFFSEGISSGYSTKGFELGYYFSKEAINYRNKGYPVALAPSNFYLKQIVGFTADGCIEGEEYYNSAANYDGDSDTGGSIIALKGAANTQYDYYVNGLSRGDILVGIKPRYVDIFDTRYLFNRNDELLTEPRFDNGGAGWTVGTGWTITDNGAEHTTGNTGTLSATINFDDTPTNSDYVRVAIKIKDCTAGKLSVGLNAPVDTADTESKMNGWFTFSFKCSSSTTGLVITPTSAFDGIIEAVNVHLYGTGFGYNKVSLYGKTDSAPHPAVIWEGDLYVACGNHVNIVSLTDRGTTHKEIVDSNFTIVSITQQAGNIILWATDGYDSKQYYWNGVDAVATEVIEWKGLIIKGVVGTETLSYVLTASGSTSGSVDGYEYRMYVVSGYQRNLIASKEYQYLSSSYLGNEPYNADKKFEFNDVDGPASMVMYLDSLFIPGCDGVYKYGYDVPGLRSNWTRPIRYDIGATNITLGQRNDFLNIGYRANNVNYIGRVNKRVYNSNGYLITSWIYWDKLGTRKALEKLKIGYKNVASTVGNIKVYAIVDDTYFWRFRPTATPTTRPEVGAVYNVAYNTTAEVINVDKTNGIITFRSLTNTGSRMNAANTTITKVSGIGDDSIAVGYKFDNMCLIKTISNENQGFGNDIIFGKDFVNNYMPYRYKIQLVIELNSNDRYISPEIYEISIASDIADEIL